MHSRLAVQRRLAARAVEASLMDPISDLGLQLSKRLLLRERNPAHDYFTDLCQSQVNVSPNNEARDDRKRSRRSLGVV